MGTNSTLFAWLRLEIQTEIGARFQLAVLEMTYKEYLLIAIRVTTSITVPVGAAIAILIALLNGTQIQGSLEFEAMDGFIFLILLPAVSIVLCVLVSPIARLLYLFLDRKKRDRNSSSHTDGKTGSEIS
jgi:hypothetical protein